MKNTPIIKLPINRKAVKPAFNRAVAKSPVDRLVIKPPRT